MNAFLAAHPGEAILMRIKNERDQDPECDGNQSCIDDEAARDLAFRTQLESELSVYTGILFQGASSSNPLLSELRGKILILDDFDGSLPSTLTRTRSWSSADIQDNYDLGDNWDLATRWWDVQDQFQDAHQSAASDPNTLHVNFLSAANGGFPYFFASGHSSNGTSAPRLLTGWTRGVINTCGSPSRSSQCLARYPSVNCFLGTCSVAFEGINIMASDLIKQVVRERTGIVMADFPGAGLIAAIIAVNDRNSSQPANTPPVVALTSTTLTVNENGTVTLGGTITDPDTTNTFELAVERGEFCPTQGTECPAQTYPLQAGATTFSVTHTYADDDPTGTPVDTYAIGVVATDSAGGSSAEVTANVTVRNVAPTVSLTGATIDEGGSAHVTGTLVDPGTLDTFSVNLTWGDAASAVLTPTAAGPFSANHVYADNGTFTVRATARDDDTGQGTGDATVTVRNVAPVVTAAGSTIPEGSLATVSGTLSDPGVNDNGTLTVNWGDGSSSDAAYVAGAGSYAHTPRYLDNGVYDVTVTAVDEDGGTSQPARTTVTVLNVPPTVTAVGQSANDGSPATLALTIDGPGTLDTFLVQVSWGDGSTTSYALGPGASAGGVQTALGLRFDATHVYADEGIYPVQVIVRDDDNGQGQTTASMTILNVAPTATVVGTAVEEGGVATVSVTISDPGVLDTFALTIHWGEGVPVSYALPAGTTSYALTHAYLDDDPTGTASDLYRVTVRVDDRDGGIGTAEGGVLVRNVAPVVGTAALRDETGAAIPADVPFALTGLAISLEAAFTDIGVRDTYAASVDWGDGTTEPVLLSATPGAGTLMASHAFATPGTVSVVTTLTDDDLGSTTRTLALDVLDPAGALCALAQQVATLEGSTNLDRRQARLVTRLVGQVQGNAGGGASNGGCDMFARGNDVAGVVRLGQALTSIEALLAGGGLTAADRTLLQHVAQALVLSAKATYLSLVAATTPVTAADLRKRADASALATLADEARQATCRRRSTGGHGPSA